MSIQDIMKLHKETGASISVCKQAWNNTNDYEKAKDYLRIQGVAKAASLADRDATEGIIAIAQNEHKVTIIKLSSETDFATRSPDFIAFTQSLVTYCLDNNIASPDQLSEEKKTEIALLVSKFRENISLASVQNVHLQDTEKAVVYFHSVPKDTDGKNYANVCMKACVVKYRGDDKTAYDIGMQVIANNTEFLTIDSITDDIKQREMDVLTTKHQGKPEAVMQKIIDSGMRTFYSENVLMCQTFIKDESITIDQLCKVNKTEILGFYKVSVK